MAEGRRPEHVRGRNFAVGGGARRLDAVFVVVLQRPPNNPLQPTAPRTDNRNLDETPNPSDGPRGRG